MTPLAHADALPLHIAPAMHAHRDPGHAVAARGLAFCPNGL